VLALILFLARSLAHASPATTPTRIVASKLATLSILTRISFLHLTRNGSCLVLHTYARDASIAISLVRCARSLQAAFEELGVMPELIRALQDLRWEYVRHYSPHYRRCGCRY